MPIEKTPLKHLKIAICFPSPTAALRTPRSDWKHERVQSEIRQVWPSCFSLTAFPVWVGLPLDQEVLLALESSERPKWSLQEELEKRAGYY